jgi:hypothetical protein
MDSAPDDDDPRSGDAGQAARDEATRPAASRAPKGGGAVGLVLAGCLTLGAVTVGLHFATRPSLQELAEQAAGGDHRAGMQLLNRHRSAWVGVAEREAQPHGALFGFGGAIPHPDGRRIDPKPGTATGWPFSAQLDGRLVILRPYRVVGEDRTRGAFMAYLFREDGELASARLHLLDPRISWDMANFAVEDGVLRTYPPDGPAFAREGDALVEAISPPGR